MAFTALYDWIHSNPATEEFRFGVEGMEKFLTDLMMNNDFAEGTCVIKLCKDIKKIAFDNQGDQSADAVLEETVAQLMDHENIYTEGLKFFF